MNGDHNCSSIFLEAAQDVGVCHHDTEVKGDESLCGNADIWDDDVPISNCCTGNTKGNLHRSADSVTVRKKYLLDNDPASGGVEQSRSGARLSLVEAGWGIRHQGLTDIQARVSASSAGSTQALPL